MPRGRPTKYDNTILEKSRQYLKECEDEQIHLLKQANEEKGYETYENKLKVKLPSIEGLALYLHIHRDTLYEWEKSYEDFSDIIEELKQKQADRLMNSGLSGDYNSTIAKLLLAKHGYKESTETEITSHGEKLSLSDIELEQMAHELAEKLKKKKCG